MLRKSLQASDFDQTLSFNDSSVVLSELIGFNSHVWAVLDGQDSLAV